MCDQPRTLCFLTVTLTSLMSSLSSRLVPRTLTILSHCSNRKTLSVCDGSHIPPHGPKGAGSKGSEASPEWQVVNRAKRKWASVWRPIANDAMSLEAMTTDPMYTTEVYKSVAVNETSVTGNEDSSEELKNAAPEVGVLGEVGSGADTVEFEEDWSQK